MRAHIAIEKQSGALKIIVFFLLMLLFYNLPLTAQVSVKLSQTIEQYEGKSYYLHVVESQQTLFGISKAYGITVESLMMANPDARRGIRVNQVLRVPAGGNLNPAAMTTTAPKPDKAANDEYEYIYHVAGKNETFAYLADIYLMNERLIRNANPSRGEPFTEGDYILVPITKKGTPPSATESQYKRSGFDPFVRTTPTPSQAQTQTQQTRPVQQSTSGSASTGQQQLTDSKPVEMVASFDQPVQQTQNRPKEPVMPDNSPKTESSTDKHIVKPQETLYSVARKYNLSPAEILSANPGMSENLKAGQIVKIPGQKQTSQSAASQGNDSLIYHTVEKGETLFRISRQYAVSIEELKKTNPGLTETLKVGQKILISKKKITQPYLIHKVENQQRTKLLARDFGITMDEINNLNPSIGKQVFPNQKVKIPLDPQSEYTPVKPGQIREYDFKQDTPDIEPDEIVSEDEYACEVDEENRAKLYRVALMLPLFLEDVEAMKGIGQRPAQDSDTPRPLAFLPFYNGFLMAADSLATHFGLKLELMVYDVDQSTAKASKALNDPKLKSVDLIIGPFFSQPFDMLASFANENKILIINPMSQRKEITYGNPFVVKLKPDVNDQFEQVAASIAGNYPDAKVFIYHSNAFRNANEVNLLKEKLEKHLPHQIKISNTDILRADERHRRRAAFATGFFEAEGRRFDTHILREQSYDSAVFENAIKVFAYDRDSIRSFRRNMSNIRDNVVVVYSEDRVFAMEFINKINQISDSISIKVIGLPHWNRFDNLFNEHLLRLNAHYLEPSFIDYNNLKTEFFIQQYRSENGIEPTNYAFEGFDIGWYFLSLLQRYGKDAAYCLPDYKAKLLQTSYSFKRTDDNNGFENTYWNIYSYRNYRLMPVTNSYFFKR
ncbi:MAG: LysM peptidoglycan-binding domain-containing protein [Bacteroidales bacterium]|nr:LysM peptidoglycan-binding domain-containing protein [Bacteroidales bacterium]